MEQSLIAWQTMMRDMAHNQHNQQVQWRYFHLTGHMYPNTPLGKVNPENWKR